MPELDGFGVIEAIRAEPAWNNLPIMLVTAKDLTDEDRQRINGRIQALTSKHRLTPERLQQHLRDLGLLV
jgi:CheY-like chemotaxis protein